MSSKSAINAKFNKIVDQFTLELSDEDKQRLVAAHNLNHRYFKESRIMVMTMLKAMGKFSYKNPEGLLDIADFLGRDDLKNKYSPILQELKNTRLRKVSSAVFLDPHYSNVEVKSALDITLGQIELGHATSGLLKQICANSKPGENKRLSEHFEDVTQKLDEVITVLRKVQAEQASEFPQLPVPESTTSILQEEIQPQQETYDSPVYENIGQSLLPLPDENKTPTAIQKMLPTAVTDQEMRVRVNTWGTPPGIRRTDKPPPPEVPAKPLTPGSDRRTRSENERRGSGKIPIFPPTKGGSLKARKNDPPPPPPVKPKPTKRMNFQIVAIHQEDEEHYTIPHVTSSSSFSSSSSSSTGNRFSGSFNTGSDSGITGDWPHPETKPKGDNMYQPLLYNVSEEEEMIYAEPM